ncbi:MAG: hypothetical protein A2W72_18095 [Burkholderiales bacterium RIFCSPLOWO2_12_67_14]|nr:MAG: hypothetical protein A3I64_07135 [Burkholderiales bacterium RIFCSPLOWO2_02_FULL_67_64]OGB40012.1 MAG: hypothetical protein A3E51_05420 [Burkholderiales bacterium RIFCSPHIGHO2_12_FULL_67_38]OGB49689.1 MAG: hypothetical protein A2W72_18095 [Burkholderiales bacterium RIFCSPLOWO2_12_67_14]OGB87197.1 MAG: hypothetical protein A3G82_19505 [Burkholderiales bacterium RIFCSPLOWO2_12_FULL_67_210]
MDTLKSLGSMGRGAEKLDVEQIKAQVSIANSMKGVADTLVDTARVEVEYLKATGADRSNFLEGRTGGVGLPAPSTTPTPHNPFPVSKSHRLGGVTMKTINDLAASACAAHSKELHRLAGISALPWAKLPLDFRRSWEAATRQILAEACTDGVLIGCDRAGPDNHSVASDPLPWIRDDRATYFALCQAGGHDVPESAIRGWSDEQCMQAEDWARAYYLRVHYHGEVQMPEMPAHVAVYQLQKGASDAIRT